MRGRPINRTIRARSDAGRRQSGRRVTAVSIAKFEHVRGPPAIPTVMVSTPVAPWLGAGKSQRPAPRGPASMLAHGARGTWSCISGAPSHARLNCARLAAGEACGAATATGVRAATTCTMESLMGRRQGRPSQDIYAFDVGDFGKFGLLRHLMPALVARLFFPAVQGRGRQAFGPSARVPIRVAHAVSMRLAAIFGRSRLARNCAFRARLSFFLISIAVS